MWSPRKDEGYSNVEIIFYAVSCEENSLTISVRSRPIRSLFFPSRRFYRFIAVKILSSFPSSLALFLLIAYSRYDRFSHEHATRMQEGRKENHMRGGEKEGKRAGEGTQRAGGRVMAGLCRRAGRGYACQLEGIQLSIA